MTGFFLLSGYAINLSSDSTDMSDIKEIKRFYTKRLISILPLYYLWALIVIVTNIVAKGIPAIWEELILFPVETLGIQSVFSTLLPSILLITQNSKKLKYRKIIIHSLLLRHVAKHITLKSYLIFYNKPIQHPFCFINKLVFWIKIC